ncbi:hypothetical protein AMEX_G27990 [Astyanax mexicanus]|uniref:Uncharacterized protein n=1 Tax=Astyanax mexicanus TaxID=7994 RepID=A0A8T2KK40_ASTMX|nr:hypothetical protein AMEX_G27990 [Astyanax mexicanus]
MRRIRCIPPFCATASDTSQQLPGPSESPSALPTGPSATSALLPSKPSTPLPPATSREEPEVHRCCTISGKHPQPRSTPSAEQRELSAPSPSQLEVIYVPASPPPSDLPEQLAIPCSPPPLTSTPLSSKSQGVKRKAAAGLEELDQDLAQDLQSYMPAHHSSRDKLSRLQLAFFEMQMDKLQIKDAKSRETNALIIRSRGEKHNIWLPGWKPHGSSSMQDFLAEKIKTTLKKKENCSNYSGRNVTFGH